MSRDIDAKFSIDSDKHNWILRENNVGKKVRLHYFPNIQQLSTFMVGFKLREFLSKGYVDLKHKSTGTPSYDSVIQESTKKLKEYIDSLVSNDDSKR